jgi:hypothetical protein
MPPAYSYSDVLAKVCEPMIAEQRVDAPAGRDLNRLALLPRRVMWGRASLPGEIKARLIFPLEHHRKKSVFQ